MTASDESAGAATAVVRYGIFISVPALAEDDGDDLVLQFVVNGPVVPRVGERLEFDGPEGRNLSLVVSEVEHAFLIKSATSAERTTVLVTAEIDSSTPVIDTARELLEPAVLQRWLSHFEQLEFPEHLRRCL
ncbi:hypothetical protein ACFXHA_43230 [Nocardia sp. NPDC059240]|uniref:hypothetical protein n=1 Tax=Nocardia sp. NPDC059240 TaxID=3346786 RepID=UPI0036CA56FB